MPNTGEDYARARQALLDAELELRECVERVAAQRRQLPSGPLIRDYDFSDGRRRVKLSEMFEDGKPYLFMYHIMYFQDDKEFCPMCSMWIDGLNGIAHHVMRRANFVAATLAPMGTLRSVKLLRVVSFFAFAALERSRLRRPRPQRLRHCRTSAAADRCFCRREAAAAL
jgi:predicted dithiol-disulfide oxidoreductase (DUF899 family)